MESRAPGTGGATRARTGAAPTARASSGTAHGNPATASNTEPLIRASLSYSDDAFVIESPDVIMASQRTNINVAYGFNEDGTIYSDRGDNMSSQYGGSSQPSTSTSSLRQQQQQQQQQFQQPLTSQSINSEDLDNASVAYGELAQPRPEIVLRWKRFAALVFVAAVSISGATYWLVSGIPMSDAPISKAEERVDFINSFSGIVMGFLESVLGLLLGNLLPVFVVYLHNLKWFPGDDPAKKSSKFKKAALMLFIPLIMVALGNSISAVQANQRTESTDNVRMRMRHLQQTVTSDEAATLDRIHRKLLEQTADSGSQPKRLEDTVLRSALSRRVVPAPPLSTSSCANTDDFNGLLQALPTATFGFPVRSWHARVYPEPTAWQQTRVSTLRLHDAKSTESLPVAPQTAVELLLQGFEQLNALANGKSPLPLDRSWLQSIGSSNASSERLPSSLLQQVAQGLAAIGLGAVDDESLSVTLERTPLSPLLKTETVTVKVALIAPLVSDGSQVVCGAQSCVFLDADLATRPLPRKQLSLLRYCSGDAAADTCQVDEHAAFLFGFTSAAQAQAASSERSKTETVPRRLLTLVFSKLSWTLDDFQTTCVPDASSRSDCRVLHHALAASNEHLVLGPVQLAQKLKSVYPSSPANLVQLVERTAVVGGVFVRVEQLTAASGNSITEMAAQMAHPSDSCSAAVDVYQQYAMANHLTIDQDVAQVLYTSALLFLFQDAAVVTRDESDESVELAVARQLLGATGIGDNYIEIYISNTRVGQISTWIGCVVLLVLSTLVIVLPNERARLEPPKGGNARAERFIAVQTEEAYPNFVYKKRFLIGKTGEEIKFGEFAVESVGLHHKMEEDEQIYL